MATALALDQGSAKWEAANLDLNLRGTPNLAGTAEPQLHAYR